MKNDNFLTKIIYLFGAIEIFLMCYSFMYSYGSMDHAEHLHASWLVWQGKIPYRDFFEHHNPLFWYILSPIVALFYHNALILYVSKVISFLSYVALFLVLYKIAKRFMGYTIKPFLLSLIIYFSLPDSYYTLFELHPDETMLAFYFMGIYYLYSYLEGKKQKELNISFLMFTISLLILQKILIPLFFVGIFILYLIYNKQIEIKPLIKASLLPIFIILIFMLWLYFNGCLKIYYLFNYELNVIMHKFYALGKVYGDYWQTLYLPFISLFAIKDFIKDRNIYKLFFVFVFVMECVSKYIFGAIHKHYFVFSNIVASIIIGEFIYRNIKQKQIKLIFLIMIISSFYLFYKAPLNKFYPQYYKMQKYIFSFMQNDDYLISTVNYINIYENDVSYYWFAGGNVAPVAYYLYQYKEPFALNEYILKYKPKFIYNNRYGNQIIHANFINGVSYGEYISNLHKIYSEMPVKLETKENFVKRWSLKEFSIYNDKIIEQNYYTHPYFPVFIRKDIIDTNYRLK